MCEIVKWMLPEDEKQTQLAEQKICVWVWYYHAFWNETNDLDLWQQEASAIIWSYPLWFFLNRNIILVPFFALNKHQSFEGPKKWSMTNQIVLLNHLGSRFIIVAYLSSIGPMCLQFVSFKRTHRAFQNSTKYNKQIIILNSPTISFNSVKVRNAI